MDKLTELLTRLDALHAAATPGPWEWIADGGEACIVGNLPHREMNPVLVTRGCGNQKKTAAGVTGCNTVNDDPLRSCPLQPSQTDRELIVALRNAWPEIRAMLERQTAGHGRPDTEVV